MSKLELIVCRAVKFFTMTLLSQNYVLQFKLQSFLMFYQSLFPPQVKRCAIITYKHDIYELPHELPNDLRHRILGN